MLACLFFVDLFLLLHSFIVVPCLGIFNAMQIIFSLFSLRLANCFGKVRFECSKIQNGHYHFDILEDETKPIMEVPEPENTSQVRSFLGMLQYYHRQPGLSTMNCSGRNRNVMGEQECVQLRKEEISKCC